MSQTPQKPPPEQQRRGPFLARRVRWNWHDDVRIDLLDDRDQPITTLDEWQTLVFHEADGNHSLDMIIGWFPTQYKDPAKVPADYRSAITEAAKFLIDDRRWVEPRDRPDDLAREVALPRSEQTATTPS